MARIKFLGETFLKQSTAQATSLPVDQKQSVSGGTTFVLESFQSEKDGHFQVTLRDDLFKGLKTWFAFADHVEIVETQSIPTLITTQTLKESSLLATVDLKVKYLNQLDNKFEPEGTCNLTCCAMVLQYFGIKPRMNTAFGDSVGLEDELFLFVQKKGWDRHVHAHLVKLLEEYGLEDEFTTTATWKAVKQHLTSGKPVICAGDFTSSGHIIVLSGYDSTGFIVQDPNGEIFFSPGTKPFYEHPTSKNPHLGANLHYSYQLMDTLAGPNGKVWIHFPSKK